jgi:lipoate-protein ligase A
MNGRDGRSANDVERTRGYNASMSELWHLLESRAADAATNMALDEALLGTAAQRVRPLLRVYSWEKPSVSFGYFQKFPAHLADRYEIVRRPTGGGVVYHGEDTTYTVVVPPDHPLYRMRTTEAYCAIHKAVAAACERLAGKRSGGSPTLQTTPPSSPRGSYECFQNPVHGDVVAGGRKLAGGAQRRTKWGMLHQGSIAARLSADQLSEGFCRELSVAFARYELTDAEQQLAEKLTREKYSTDGWNHRVR